MGAQPALPKTLANVARLYDLIEQLDDVVKELRGANVEVFFGGLSSKEDPLAQKPAVRITFHPAGEILQSYR